jgi:hypothetical protein
MKYERCSSVWGIAVFSLGMMACTDQGPLVPEGLDPQFAKGGGAKPVKVTVEETDPSAAEQDTTLDVRVLGSGFDDGSKATWLLAGDPKPNQVRTNSTGFVSETELIANITIDAEATVALWDVEVMTLRRKKGIGIESFEVKSKSPPGQVEFDDYTVIDLGTLGRRKGISSGGQVSDPFPDGMILVTGRSQESDRSDELPVMWEVTVTEADTSWIGPIQMPLPPTFYSGRAGRISDDTHYIIGWAAYDDGQTLYRAVRWEYEDGVGVDGVVAFEPFVHPTNPNVEFIASSGRGVNIHGDVVGNSSMDHPVFWDIDGDGEYEFEASKIATFWEGGSGEPTPLLSPLRGQSIAYGVNNQRYVVGYGKEPAYFNPSGVLETHAVLWMLDGTRCDLGEPGSYSVAYNLTDVSSAGMLFVTGTWESRGTVWEVRPNADQTCTVVNRWTMDVESIVGGIRVVEGGWETVGMGQIITPGHDHPMAWRRDFTGLTVTPLSEEGRPYGVNSQGVIGGHAPVKGLDHAMLWLPNNR